MFKMEEYFAFITTKAGKLLSAGFERKINHLDITRVQWMALHYIERTPGLTQKDLAEQMELKESCIVKLIDLMEENELVVRTIYKKDRRIKTLTLTEKGKETNKELVVLVKEYIDESFKDITQEEADTFNRVLKKIVDNIQNKR